MQITTQEVSGFTGAIRGMREPFESWSKSDSDIDAVKNILCIGPVDMKLDQNLLSTDSDSDSKFLRMIHVQAEITAPAYFIAELATYKVGTTMSSSSLQHIGANRDFVRNDFEIDEHVYSDDYWNFILEQINSLRRRYKETNNYKYFRQMRQLIPQSFQYTVMWDANYQTLRNIYKQRIEHPHRLKEWTECFKGWMETLPYYEDLIKFIGENK